MLRYYKEIQGLKRTTSIVKGNKEAELSHE